MLKTARRAGIFVVLSAAAVMAQQFSPPPADARLSKAWLRSSDARERAWGAYLALNGRLTDLAPELLAILSEYPAIPEVEKDQRDALLAVLDALIQLGIDVPAADAARIYRQFPAQSLILLSRSSEDIDGELLDIFQQGPREPGWLAAGNLLAGRRAPAFAAAVLANMSVRAVVAVTSPDGEGYGRGGSSCCGAGLSPQTKAGWPPAGNYELRCGNPAPPSSVVLATGTDMAYYFRTVNSFYASNGPVCGCHLDPDLARQHFLNSLLSIPPEEPVIPSSLQRSILWQTPAAYLSDLLAFIREQQEGFVEAAQKLQAAGLLTAEAARSARPALAIEVWDQRTPPAPPLPVLAGSEGVIFTQSSL